MAELLNGGKKGGESPPNVLEGPLAGLHDIVALFMEQAKGFMELLGITAEQVEFAYEYGLGLYQAGKYDEAKHVFYLLSQLNEKDPRFPFAYASCCSKLKDLTAAIQYYSLSAMLDGENPAVWYNIGDCYLQKQEFKLSAMMLDVAIDKAGVHPEHSSIRNDAESLRQIALHHGGGDKSS